MSHYPYPIVRTGNPVITRNESKLCIEVERDNVEIVDDIYKNEVATSI